MWKAWIARQTPHTVITGENGVVFVYRRKESEHLWTDFAHAATGVSGASSEPYLLLFDTAGRRFTKLSGEIENFDAMAEIIKHNVAKARKRTEKRVPIQRQWVLSSVYILVGCLLGSTACFFAWHSIWRFGEFVNKDTGPRDILEYVLFLGLWLFGIVMATLFIAGAVLHLARFDINRSPSGLGFILERESKY